MGEMTFTPIKNYAIYVSQDRTVMATLWHATGVVEVATRESPDHIWGPPVQLTEEK